jgi:hypothetical protein
MSHLDRLHQLEERVARLEAARVDPAQDSRASTVEPGEQDTKADVQNVPEVEVKPSTQTPTKRPRRDDEK